MTSSLAKTEKRIQTQFAHEYGQWSGAAPSPEFLRHGELSYGPERTQQIRAAYILGPQGRDIFGPGAAGVADLGEFRTRTYREIEAGASGAFDWVARRGAEFAPGSRMALGSGMRGEELGKWGARVLDVTRLPGETERYGFTLEKYTDIEDARAFHKAGGGKHMFVHQPEAVRGARLATGEELNLQMIHGLKDVQGSILEFYQGRGTEYFQRALAGVGVQVDPKEPWSAYGQQAMQAFMQQEQGRAFQTIHVPQRMTAENLRGFAASGALVRGSARHLGEGIYRADVAYQALMPMEGGKVLPMGIQTGHMFPGKTEWLGFEQLEAMRRDRPGLYQAVMANPEAKQARWAHQEVIQAAATTAGEPVPAGAISAGQLPLAGMLSGATLAAQAEVGEGKDPTMRQVVGQFMGLMAQHELGGQPIAVDVPGKGTIMAPAPLAMQRFRATGQEGEEMSAYQYQYMNLMQAVAGGSEKELQQAAAAFSKAQLEVAGGKQFFRKAFGAPLPKSMSTMDVMHTSLALKPGQVSVPGAMPGEAVMATRYPERAEAARLTGVQISERTRELAGLSEKQMAYPMELTQALAGDDDGDLTRAMRLGDVKQQPDGTWTDKYGSPLSTPTDFKVAAKNAIEEGAGVARQEMYGLTGSAVSRSEAVDWFRGQIDSATVSTQAEVRQQVREGSELRGRIGQYYNVFRAGGEGMVAEAAPGMEKLFQQVHGRAQRPAPLTEQGAQLMSLAKMSLWSQSQGGRLASHAFSPQEGGPRLATAVRGLTGLWEASARTLVGMRGESGAPFLTGQEFAGMMGGTEGTAKAFEAAQAATGKGAFAQAQAMTKLIETMPSPVKWGLESAVGRMLAPAAVERAMHPRDPSYSAATAKEIGLTESEAQQFMGVRAQQRAIVEATARRSVGGSEEAFLSKLGAMRQVLGARGMRTMVSGIQPTTAEERLVRALGSASTPDAPTAEVQASPSAKAQAVTAQRIPTPAEVTTNRALWASADPWAAAAAMEGGDPSVAAGGAAAVGAAVAGGGGFYTTVAGTGAGGFGGGGGRPPTTAAPAAAPMGGGGPMHPFSGQPAPGSRMYATRAGDVRVRTEAGSIEIARIQEINRNLDKFGKSILDATETTDRLSTAQKSGLRIARTYANEIRRISDMSRTGDVEQRLGPELARAFPHMGYLGQASARLDAEALGGMAGGPPPTMGQRLGGLSRELMSGWGMMKMRRWWGMTGGRAQQWRQAAAQEEAGLYAASMQAGAPIAAPGGIAGGLMAQQMRAQAGRVALGRQVAGAWTPPAQLGMWEEGPMGAALGIAMPAAGVGMIGGYLGTALGIPGLGLPLAAGAAALGGANYLYNAAASDTGAAVGYADLMNVGGRRGQAGFQQQVGGFLRSAWEWGQAGFPGEQTEWERQAIQTGGAIMEGRTSGLTGAQMSEAMRMRGERMAETHDIMGAGEYAAMEAQMMRYGGYRELRDVPEDLSVRSAAMTRALGLGPGQLQQRLGGVAGGWGVYGGTEQMQQWQASMLAAPSVPDLERQLSIYQQYQPLARLGVGMEAVGGAPRLGIPQQQRLAAFAGGDRYLWSNFGRAMGDRGLVTMEEGGMPLFTTGLGMYGAGELGLQTQAAQGGMWGIQDAMLQAQRGYRDVGMGRRGAQLAWQGQMMQQQWGLQDQMWNLSGTAQMEQFGYQQQMFDVRNRQWEESQRLSRATFEARVGWQQEDMDKQRDRAEQRYGWAMEDWTYSENVAQLRFGWKMEDYDESIRRSSGRQRQQLQRHRERDVTLESMRREHHEDQKERLEEQRGWQEEDFDKSKERNETLIGLQRRRFDLAKRHHDETRQLQQRHMTAVRGNYLERRKLEARQRDLQRENARRQHEWAMQAHADQVNLNKQMDALLDDQRTLQRTQQQVIANWGTLANYMDDAFEQYKEHIGDLLGILDSRSRPSRDRPAYDPGAPPGGSPGSGPGSGQPGMGGSGRMGTAGVGSTTTVNVFTNSDTPQGVADAVSTGLSMYDEAQAR
jgi:hypothetical protein